MKLFDPTIFGFNRKRNLNYGLYFYHKDNDTYYTINIINDGICEIYKNVLDSKWIIYQGLIPTNSFAKELLQNLGVIEWLN